MLRGVYLSASGMSVDKKQLDIVANNIANANTPGFRAKRTSIGEFGREIVQRIRAGRGTTIGIMDQGPGLQSTQLAGNNGSTQFTGRALDVATRDPSVFLAIETDTGTSYSRGGSLYLTGDGYLVNAGGDRILGSSGPIQVDGQAAAVSGVSMGANGEVLVGDEVVDHLQLVQLDLEQADWTPDGLVRVPSGAATKLDDLDGAVIQGAIEQSNVDLIGELNELIRTSRLYQINQQTLKIQDDAVRTAVSRVGELS